MYLAIANIVIYSRFYFKRKIFFVAEKINTTALNFTRHCILLRHLRTLLFT